MAKTNTAVEKPKLPISGQHEIGLTLLQESGLNCRRDYDKKKMEELVASVKTHGILENLVLRPVRNLIKDPSQMSIAAPDAPAELGPVVGYQVICGSRRWKAAIEAGLVAVPATIREITDDEAREIMMVENLQRVNVHPLEEAEGFLELSKKYPDLKVLAGRVGKTPNYIKLVMQLNFLIEPVRKAFLAGDATLDHALEISRLLPEQQKETWKECSSGSFDGSLLSVRALRDFIQRRFYLNLAKAPFNIEDLELVAAAGSCVNCPKRTGANGFLFSDIKNEDTCTDPKCFSSKVAAHIAREKATWVAAHPGAMLHSLSTAYDKPKDPVVLPRGSFEIVSAKEAKESKEPLQQGIVVSAPAGGEDLGKIVFWRLPLKESQKLLFQDSATRQAALSSKEQDLDVRRHNEEDMAAIPALMTAIRAFRRDPKIIRSPLIDLAPLTVTELQLVAEECIGRCGHDLLKRYCDSTLGTKEIPETSYGRDYVKAAVDRAHKLVKDAPTLAVFLLELTLFSSVGWGHNGGPDKNPIYRIARTRGVTFDEVFKPIREKYDVRRERVAKRLGLAKPEPAQKPQQSSGNEKSAPGSKQKKIQAGARKKSAMKSS